MTETTTQPAQSMAQAIAARIAQPSDVSTAIAGLSLFRRNSPSPPCICMVEPSIVLVAQGEKQLWVGAEGYAYDPSRFLVTSLDLPANSEVLKASEEAPCVGLVLKLDLRILAELIAQGGLPLTRERAVSRGVGIGTMSPGLLSSFGRLVDLLDDADAIPVLAPLIQREIHFRLLRSDQAARLRQIASVDSQGYRIAKAVDWLKQNFHLPLRIEDLAARVQMSPPTFHHHFRQLTAMSPLQYQKWLRLNEARRLMLNEHLDVSRAAFSVGYESPSQFSREYSRLFGIAPRLDLKCLRGHADAGAPRE
ncbi:AraC family transcriptional regulator [Pseudomonas sp. PDM17]|nr:AraC family transcriptional regulator [Pseudomonas sp. PDM17]MBD9500612.1 AraC family transcriptional regulator [Pseudomonas sp. PDM17]